MPTTRSSWRGKTFIGGDAPSIADIRLAATLEFLNGIDYEFPAWAKEYTSAVEAGPRRGLRAGGGDVREFIASVEDACLIGITRPS